MWRYFNELLNGLIDDNSILAGFPNNIAPLLVSIMAKSAETFKD
jgi:hypothetical protein